MDWNQWLIVVPARLQSTRLKRKPLQLLGDKPLIVQVARRLSPLASRGAKIIVATDSLEVAEACQSEKIEVTLTSPTHPSGTDRVHEVATSFPDYQFILNVQGDEPFVNLNDLSRLADVMQSDKTYDLGTLVHKNSSRDDWLNPNVVKAVISSSSQRVLYFSRSAVPYHRNQNFEGFWHHIGVYAFQRQALETFCSLPPSELETMEGLEQLRALENQLTIGFAEASEKAIGIDTPEDLEAAREFFQQSCS